MPRDGVNWRQRLTDQGYDGKWVCVNGSRLVPGADGDCDDSLRGRGIQEGQASEGSGVGSEEG